MPFGQSHWEWSRSWKPPMFEGNQNFIPKLIQDFRSPFVYMTWSLYRISKDKILHKVRKAGLGTLGVRSRAVLHSPTSAGVHTRACVLHSCSHAHSVHLKTSSSHSYCPWITPCATDVARQDSQSVINQPARKNNTTGDVQFCLFPHWMGH